MDVAEVDRWFAAYLADFAALGRGEGEDVRRMLDHYSVPLILSSDSGCRFLTDEAQVLAAAQQQADGMRSTGYDRSEELVANTTVLNQSCSVHRGRFARLRADGTEISQLEMTYLITDGPAGRRISAMVVHTSQ